MNTRLLLTAALALAVCASTAPLAYSGGQLPAVEIEEFGKTKAKSFDEFAGRAVLIEFFAYW